MKKILLTGGGSAGHVTPNLALIPALREAGFEVEYIGGKSGIEKSLAENAGVPYHAISTGKLRRDKLVSMKNFKDAWAAVAGIGDAIRIIRRIKPDIIFSKGGFVGLPVAAAGWLCRVGIILHESDMTSGLANRLSMGFARVICASFPETMASLPPKKAVLTGNPIRRELLEGDPVKGRKICGFNGEKPLLLVTGGSLGSEKLNSILWAALPLLLPYYDIVHLCGRNKKDSTLDQTPGYAAFEYLNEDLAHVMAAADFIVSRAGASAINEFLALRKPSLLIPLENRATRGDQVKNADSFVSRGFSLRLEEPRLTPETLAENLEILREKSHTFVANMEKSPLINAVDEVVRVICSCVDQHK